MKFDNKLEEEYFSNRILKGEVARYNMVEFCEYFKKDEKMSKDQFFKLQKDALAKFKKDSH